MPKICFRSDNPRENERDRRFETNYHFTATLLSATRFDQWLAQSGTTLTRKALSEGIASDYGDPSRTWTESTFKAFVARGRQQMIQAPEGIVFAETRRIYFSRSQALNERDKVVIDGLEWKVGPVITFDACKQAEVRRIIQ